MTYQVTVSAPDLSDKDLVIATDLDGTFLGGSEQDRRRFYDWIRQHRDRIGLVFVTGRDPGFISDLTRQGFVPRPDYVVGDVGTTVARMGHDHRLYPLEDLEAPIAEAWDAVGLKVQAALAGQPGLKLQSAPFRYRLSYDMDPARFDAQAVEIVETLGLDALISDNRYFDVLPKDVSKGPTLQRFLDHFGIDPRKTLVAGDTLNDFSMLAMGVPAVAVGNSEPALLERLQDLAHVHRAEGHGVNGIAEAIDALQLFETSPKGTDMSSDLVIVYHRQPYEEVEEDGKIVLRENKSPNGIVPTLKSFFGSVDRGAWIAWKLAEDPENPEFEQRIEIDDAYGRYSVSRLPLSEDQVREFYHVTSKEAFWPILHSFKERYNYDPVDWENFQAVNRRFAEAAAAEAAEGALVWVHDYNLWLVPGYLRALRPDLRIAFFHHTPFPSADVFNMLPWRKQIIQSLLACDDVGFHIPRYAANFVSVARSLFDVDVSDREQVPEKWISEGTALTERVMPTCIQYEGRDIAVSVTPVGVAVDFVDERAKSDQAAAQVKQIREELGDAQLILSVGRTDYTKGGIVQLESYERLLEANPDLHGKVRLMHVSVSANRNMTAYEEIQNEIEQAAGRINGRFGTFDWQPVALMSRAIPFAELIGYYCAADVAWITPLADGMNLVCKEYVAARIDGDGVLVLSEFAGAAVELDDAVIVNPYSHRSMDNGILQALEMHVEERKQRMAKLRDAVAATDVSGWKPGTLSVSPKAKIASAA